MAYIDRDCYTSFSDIDIPQDEFDKLAKRASDIVDIVTFNRIETMGGLTALPSHMQTSIKKATASQVEMIYIDGGIESMASASAVKQASIGKFSYSTGATSDEGNSNSITLSPMAKAYLAPTGLLYRGLC